MYNQKTIVMNNKKIEITALSISEITETMELKDTAYLYDMIEDLAEVIQYLGGCDDIPRGGITAVAYAQKLLIDICRAH